MDICDNLKNFIKWHLFRLQRHSGLLSVASSFSLCQACLPVRMVPDMWDGWWMNTLSLLNLVIFWCTCTFRSSINGGMQLFTHFTNWFLKENFSQLDFVICYTVLFWLGLGQGQELWPLLESRTCLITYSFNCIIKQYSIMKSSNAQPDLCILKVYIWVSSNNDNDAALQRKID